MMKVLLTGFGPFKDFEVNPSAQLVEALFSPIGGVVFRKEIFDVNQGDIELRLPEILEAYQPHFILNVGLSANTPALTLETFAINSLKDKTKQVSIGNDIGFKSKINTKELAHLLCEKNIPSICSDYAGSYYCNLIYYHSLAWAETHKASALFLHIPFPQYLACQVYMEKGDAFPSLPFDTMIEGTQEIIKYVYKQHCQQRDVLL